MAAKKPEVIRCTVARRLRRQRVRVQHYLIAAWCKRKWRAYKFWRAMLRLIDLLGDAVDPVGLYCYRPDPDLSWAPW